MDIWESIGQEIAHTNPLETRYFTFTAKLVVESADVLSAARSLYDAYKYLKSIQDHNLQGSRYIVYLESHLHLGRSDLGDLVPDISSESEGVFSAAVRISVIGGNREVAQSRLVSHFAWLQEISRTSSSPIEQLKWESSGEVISIEGGIDLPLAPETQVINFPNAKYWQISSSEDIDTTASIEQFTRHRLVHFYTIRTDSLREATVALESTRVLLPTVLEDTYQWKWVIMTLHNTLQNFMIAALQGTNPERVMVATSDSNGNQRWSLMPFLDMYKEIKRDRLMLQFSNSKTFTPQGNQGSNVKLLNRLRNDFTHFTPKTWILEADYIWCLPQMVYDILDIIDFLAFHSNNTPWYLDESLQLRARDALDQSRDAVINLADSYENAAGTLVDRAYAQRIRLKRPLNG